MKRKTMLRLFRKEEGNECDPLVTLFEMACRQQNVFSHMPVQNGTFLFPQHAHTHTHLWDKWGVFNFFCIWNGPARDLRVFKNEYWFVHLRTSLVLNAPHLNAGYSQTRVGHQWRGTRILYSDVLCLCRHMRFILHFEIFHCHKKFIFYVKWNVKELKIEFRWSISILLSFLPVFYYFFLFCIWSVHPVDV